MNERIKELMIEAGYAAPELAIRAQKLTELLVIDISHLLQSRNPRVEPIAHIYIKKVFGVME